MATPLRVVWTPMPEELSAQQLVLAQVLLSWDLTPYHPRKQDRGRGVDCVRFVAAQLDDVRGRKTPIETLPDDAAMHNREAAIAAMLRLKRALDPNTLLRWEPRQPAEVQPGDVVVTGPIGGGPGHAMIVGCSKNVLWESCGTGVRRVGLSSLTQAGRAVFYVFRCTDRASWRTA